MNILNTFLREKKKYKNEKFKFVTYEYNGINGIHYKVKPGKYVISNYGRLFNFITEKELKYFIDKDGYYKLGITFISDKNEKSMKNVFIHRLVAWEYCKHKKDCNIINHKDANINNNYYKNLEWTTVKGNTDHAIKMGLTIRAGTNTASSKYSQELIDEICKKLDSGESVYNIYKFLCPGCKVSDNIKIYALIRTIATGERHLVTSKKYNFLKIQK